MESQPKENVTKERVEIPERVVFFDGMCGFCNASVNFLMDQDTSSVLRFATLQGDLAAEVLEERHTRDLDTIVYLREGSVHMRTDALLWILHDVGGGWKLLRPLMAIPADWRDPAYKLFAKYRYKLFGKLDACRLPTPEERARFLD